MPSIPSFEFVPDTMPAALLVSVSLLDQVAEMLLRRVSPGTEQRKERVKGLEVGGNTSEPVHAQIWKKK